MGIVLDSDVYNNAPALKGAPGGPSASLCCSSFCWLSATRFGSETILHIAGYEGILCGLSAMYTGLGEVMNEVYKEKIVKLG